ncbi:MAG: helix-turn-helix transcriptional regulator [Desulfuromonadales bacterium]|nr:helix-turn-helix transcriptional regulator [Desulfuromonadales bacterium]
MENARAEVKELQIGMKIRRLRQDKRMTLQALADRTGLSKPLLSQIENEQVIPPLATLLRIAKAFDVGLHHFFQEEGARNCIFVRAGETRKRAPRNSTGFDLSPYLYNSLAYGKKGSHFEPFMVEFEQREMSDDLLVSHEGEEFLFLLEGELVFHYGEQIMRMRPGDSVCYDSSERHGYVAVSQQRPRAVAVVFSKP